ncbi:MAG: PAS domain S-box protein [Spirochaeta sp.]|jgi:PAS domain S-box-containing protein|nr:PAS domain S-box protein [Spirochaeta sp.]
MSASTVPHILLVEDQALIALSEKRLLEGHGYRVSVTHTGEDAIRHVTESDDIDLILMDINLGSGIDGPDAARHILGLRDVPIVFLTSHAEKDYVERVAAISGYGYVLKTSGEFVLIQSVKMAFRLFRSHIATRAQSRRLHESEQWLSTTFDSIGDAVIATDTGGYVTRLNPAAQSLTGYDAVAACGRRLGEVFPIHNAKTGAEVGNPVATVLETGTTVGLANHTVLTARDGAQYQIADSAAPITDQDGGIIGVVLVFRDVTEEYRRRELLKRSESQLRRAQEIAHLGSWEIDLTDGTVHASSEAHRMYGIPEGSFAIEIAKSVVHDTDRARLDRAMKDLLAQRGEYDVTFSIDRMDTGETRLIHSIAEYDAEHNQVFGIIQDITGEHLTRQ